MAYTMEHDVQTCSGVEDLIKDALYEYADGNGMNVHVASFDEVGLMTRDSGLVIRIGDAEFQMTMVQSR
jgi:D-ribose pyranose/furanose isomerase RbsD